MGQDNNVMKKDQEFYLPLERNLWKSFHLNYSQYKRRGIVVAIEKDKQSNNDKPWNILMINLYDNSLWWTPQHFRDSDTEAIIRDRGGKDFFKKIKLNEEERKQSFKVLFEDNFVWNR
jgi:hypothetical protein